MTDEFLNLAKKPVKPTKPVKAKTMHGILVATDGVSAMTLRVKGKEEAFAVSNVVAVTLNKQPATFADLLVGDNCFVVQDGSSGLVTAIDARREDDTTETSG